MDEHISLHIDGELLERVDAEVVRRMQRGGSPQDKDDAKAANRSAVTRVALAEYLRRQELAA